jgi:hypothetical protein
MLFPEEICTFMCGIIPDVMNFSLGWRHLNSNVTLLTICFFNLKVVLYVQYLYLTLNCVIRGLISTWLFWGPVGHHNLGKVCCRKWRQRKWRHKKWRHFSKNEQLMNKTIKDLWKYSKNAKIKKTKKSFWPWTQNLTVELLGV